MNDNSPLDHPSADRLLPPPVQPNSKSSTSSSSTLVNTNDPILNVNPQLSKYEKRPSRMSNNNNAAGQMYRQIADDERRASLQSRPSDTYLHYQRLQAAKRVNYPNNLLRDSIDNIRRQTLTELAKRRKSWNRLKASEWSFWGKCLFTAGLVIVIWCVGTLVLKLAYIDFYLYQLRDDRQFMKSDFQRMLQSERKSDLEINYEPIIRRTCSTDNFKFIISLIVCCVATAIGFLLICFGLSGITVEVEEKIDENLLNYLKSIYNLQNTTPNIEDFQTGQPIYSSYQTLYAQPDLHITPSTLNQTDFTKAVPPVRQVKSCPEDQLHLNAGIPTAPSPVMRSNKDDSQDLTRTLSTEAPETAKSVEVPSHQIKSEPDMGWKNIVP